MNDTVLIIESGSTKTEWALVGGGTVRRTRTAGINHALQDPKTIIATVLSAAEALDVAGDQTSPEAQPTQETRTAHGIQTAAETKNTTEERTAAPVKPALIRCYGAGIGATRDLSTLNTVFKTVFPGAAVAFGSDLLAAGEAAFGSTAGVVAILGTGSNAGLFDGRKIIQPHGAGGYILGDEGSGSAIGRALLSDSLKHIMPEPLLTAFNNEYGLTYQSIVENVYRGPNPSRYLASFAPFAFANRGVPYIDDLIDNNLRLFITRNLLGKYDFTAHEVAVIGSVGSLCREDLCRLGPAYGIRFTRFIKSPIDALIQNCTDQDYDNTPNPTDNV